MIQLWKEASITEAMSESLILLDYCLVSLAKSGRILKLKNISEFFKPLYKVDKYVNKIFYYLKINWLSLNSDTIF